MSIGLTLYIAEKRVFDYPNIVPQHIITLDDTSLVEFFKDGPGQKLARALPKNSKLYHLTFEDEDERLVNTDPFGEELTYCYSDDFYSIPKEILKEDGILIKSAVKFIRKLPNCIVILYYT